MVRFRKPESRAAHCRQINLLNFWMLQQKMVDFCSELLSVCYVLWAVVGSGKAHGVLEMLKGRFLG